VDLSILGVLVGMVALGFRHGFDWDHIAAITDITSTTTAGHTEVDVPAGAPVTPHGHEPSEMRGHAHHHQVEPSAMHSFGESRFAHEQRHAIGLASLYALGHASVVVVLGVLALLLGGAGAALRACLRR
jgi:high-affinity nickel-transport protein